MLNCLKVPYVILLVLIFSACQTTPKQVPEVKPETTKDPIAEPVEEIIDINRQAYEAGITALKNNETGFAIELLVQATSNSPELEFAYTNLGLAYFKKNDFEKSEQSFHNAIKTNDKDSIAFNHMGILKRMNGDFSSAKENYQKAISIDDNYADAHLNLGILYDIYLQNLNSALHQYEKYQTLTNSENKTVKGWIADIRRQIKANNKKTKG